MLFLTQLLKLFKSLFKQFSFPVILSRLQIFMVHIKNYTELFPRTIKQIKSKNSNYMEEVNQEDLLYILKISVMESIKLS